MAEEPGVSQNGKNAEREEGWGQDERWHIWKDRKGT